jgi:heat-inducible transcriptional repressor
MSAKNRKSFKNKEKMTMNVRKRQILSAIVDHYIKTGQAVSSQTILETYGPQVSSATIRNDMKFLEKYGFISKSWSSSGRTPTTKGYRFFVDWIIELSELGHKGEHAIMESYEFQRQRLEDLLRQTAFLLASLTGYVAFVLSPKLESTELESITLVKLDQEHLLMVIVSNLGIIETRVLQADYTPEELFAVSELLNRSLRGRRLDQIRDAARRQIQEIDTGTWGYPAAQEAVALLHQLIDRQMKRHLHVEGVLNLLKIVFNWEEGLSKARYLMALLEDETRFTHAVDAIPVQPGRVSVAIGEENPSTDMEPYSLVSMDYGFGGVLGILGPVQMDYSKVFATTKYIGNRLQTILTVGQRATVMTQH